MDGDDLATQNVASGEGVAGVAAGSGNGVFDFQAKALPEAAHPINPLLLCNYATDNDRVYDWVLKYQGESKPAVFLLGSKGDPDPQP